MKNSCYLITLLLLAFGCRAVGTEEKSISVAGTDQLIAEQNSGELVGNCIDLPDLELDQERFGERHINDGKRLNEAEIIDLQLQKIDSIDLGDYPGLQYFLLKTLYENENGTVLLLSRTYDMEIMAWVVTYNKSNNLIDFKRVFYDEFAESLTHTVTVVEDNKLEISNYSYNPETDEDVLNSEQYCITPTLHFSSAN